MRALIQQLNLTTRILIAFWITMVLVIIFSIGMLAIDREDFDGEGAPPPTKIGDEVAQRLLQEDYKSVKEWFAKQPLYYRDKIFILNKEVEILNRYLPRILKRISVELNEDRPFIQSHRRRLITLGRLLPLPSGENVKILVILKKQRPPWHEIILDNLPWVMLASILITGFISYGLARYISRPLRSLRAVTKQLAGGDLSARVLPNIVNRKDEVYLLAKDFDHMAEKLQRSMESQKRLIQDISHELRSPLARLQIALELARKRMQSNEQQDLDRIENECQQLNDIITTLLNLPSYELQPELALNDQVDIGELLNTLSEDLNYSGNFAPIKVENNLDNTMIIQANGQLLRSALENVMKNAQLYSDQKQPVLVTITQNNSYLEIKCKDSGPGVPEGKLAEIFKPFYRASDARERSSGGHGLGLAIAKRAVELHQGDIKAYNIEPKGLCIHINLPILSAPLESTQ